jgi:hypothetical protein
MDTYMLKYNQETLDEIIKLNLDGLSLNELSIHYNTCYQNIQSLLKKFNEKLPVKWPKNKEVAHDFFDNIDNEIKAYLFGFFLADGCVYDKNRIGICLSNIDEYIIDLYRDYIYPKGLKKILNNTKGALNRKPQIIFRINSFRIVNALAKYGVGPRKTYADIQIPKIDDELIHHVIRGYFDGDGCICIRLTGINKGLAAISIVNGSDSILKSINSYIPKDIKTSILYRKTSATLNIRTQSHIIEFGNYIYKDANFYLQRKKDKFNLIRTTLR